MELYTFTVIPIAIKASIAIAEAAKKRADELYKSRIITTPEYESAQLALTQAQQTQAQALADYRIGLARLDLAVGRE